MRRNFALIVWLVFIYFFACSHKTAPKKSCILIFFFKTEIPFSFRILCKIWCSSRNRALCFENENEPQNPNSKLFVKWQSSLLRALRIPPQSPASDYVSRKINCAEEFLRTLNFHRGLLLRPAKYLKWLLKQDRD